MNKISIDEKLCVPIVGEAAVATESIAGGRMIPALTLDCSNHQELLNLLNLHGDAEPGDATCTWAITNSFFKPVDAFLLIEFTKPSSVKFALEFDLSKYGNVADGIVQSNGVYLMAQTNNSTKPLLDDKSPKVIVEVHPNTKLPNWDKVLLKVIKKNMKKKGMSNKEAKQASHEFLQRTREVWGFRMSKRNK